MNESGPALRCALSHDSRRKRINGLRLFAGGFTAVHIGQARAIHKDIELVTVEQPSEGIQIRHIQRRAGKAGHFVRCGPCGHE